MHNGDRDGFPRAKRVSQLWALDDRCLCCEVEAEQIKVSNKLTGDVACLGGSMVEHQPRLLGSPVRFPAGAFAIFSVSAKASLPISLSLSPFPSSSFPFPSHSDL